MDDIRDDFILCIDAEELRLENLPNFVFICGGVRNNIDEELPGSMRDALLRRIELTDRTLSSRIREAEEFQDWLEHSKIDNLIDLEIVLADLASAVILIVEGLGAYAELGAFSIIESISKKLITVLNTDTIIDKSFINLGVIKFLEDNKKLVLKYKWGVEYVVSGDRKKVNLRFTNNLAAINNKADIILDRLKQEISIKTQSTVKFDRERKGHICLAIADLIYVFSALKVSEIKIYLSVGFSIELTVKKIKEYLYILENLEFINRVDSGDIFYVASENNLGFIKYRYNSEKTKITSFSDIDDVKTKIILFYRERDISRNDALNR
ncbi:retron St85 family effector protein [Lelliottia wanjuensis]|uniref:retron St85 family effector protein n=1 Tax=Lelliottia wanjuensis TaxID=3050585 RepID=UPI00254EC220|nr:retron St85 family effector protein [Lelliottia sp. V86_10]MDK9585640.1 retron St85 family effector protein [Lelliottia sp. V86_10]